MARRVKYGPEIRGLREVGRSSQVGQAALEGARRVAAVAKADNPSGEYSVRPATVVAGMFNERRAGAEVVEEKPGRGPARRTLARAAREARG